MLPMVAEHLNSLTGAVVKRCEWLTDRPRLLRGLSFSRESRLLCLSGKPEFLRAHIQRVGQLPQRGRPGYALPVLDLRDRVVRDIACLRKFVHCHYGFFA